MRLQQTSILATKHGIIISKSRGIIISESRRNNKVFRYKMCLIFLNKNVVIKKREGWAKFTPD